MHLQDQQKLCKVFISLQAKACQLKILLSIFRTFVEKTKFSNYLQNFSRNQTPIIFSITVSVTYSSLSNSPAILLLQLLPVSWSSLLSLILLWGELTCKWTCSSFSVESSSLHTLDPREPFKPGLSFTFSLAAVLSSPYSSLVSLSCDATSTPES